MTKQEATYKLARFLFKKEQSAKEILDFVLNCDMNEETGEQIGLGLFAPMNKKGKHEWDLESDT